MYAGFFTRYHCSRSSRRSLDPTLSISCVILPSGPSLLPSLHPQRRSLSHVHYSVRKRRCHLSGTSVAQFPLVFLVVVFSSVYSIQDFGSSWTRARSYNISRNNRPHPATFYEYLTTNGHYCPLKPPNAGIWMIYLRYWQ